MSVSYSFSTRVGQERPGLGRREVVDPGARVPQSKISSESGYLPLHSMVHYSSCYFVSPSLVPEIWTCLDLHDASRRWTIDTPRNKFERFKRLDIVRL